MAYRSDINRVGKKKYLIERSPCLAYGQIQITTKYAFVIKFINIKGAINPKNENGSSSQFRRKKNVEEYIAEAVQYLRCPKSVQDTALKMYYYMAKNTSFLGLSPSMRGMTLVNLVAKENFYHIRSESWSGLCAYNRLLQHSKEFKNVLEQSDDFANLRRIRIGR